MSETVTFSYHKILHQKVIRFLHNVQEGMHYQRLRVPRIFLAEAGKNETFGRVQQLLV